MIGQQLYRNGVEDRRHEGINAGKCHHLLRLAFKGRHPIRVAEKDHLATARDHLLGVGGGFLEQRVAGRDHNHRHVVFDQRDGTVLHLSGGIALGVDIGNLLQFQRPFQCDGKGGATPEIDHVTGLGHVSRDGAQLFIVIENIGGARRHLHQRRRKCRLAVMTDGPSRLCGRDNQTGQHRQLGGEGLGGGDADFRPGMGAQHQIGLARYGAFRHINQGHDMLALFAGETQRRQGVGGLSRL